MSFQQVPLAPVEAQSDLDRHIDLLRLQKEREAARLKRPDATPQRNAPNLPLKELSGNLTLDALGHSKASAAAGLKPVRMNGPPDARKTEFNIRSNSQSLPESNHYVS